MERPISAQFSKGNGLMMEDNMDQRSPKVTVCIVTYNRHKDVLECMDSIYASLYRDFDVIVFDNCSDNKISEEQLHKYPNLQYVSSASNLGVAGGRRECEKMAAGEYLLFLDDDVLFDENAIGELVRTMDDDRQIGIVAPKMFYYDNGKTDVFLGALGRFSKLTTYCTDIACRQKDVGQFEKQAHIDYAQNGFMVRKTASALAGGYNADLFMTYQEPDFFIRIQKAGYKTLYIPGAKLWHKVRLHYRKSSMLRDKLGLTGPDRIYYNMRNRSVMVKRYYEWYAKAIYLLFFVHTYFLFYFLNFIVYKAPGEYFENLFRGYVDGLLIYFDIKKL